MRTAADKPSVETALLTVADAFAQSKATLRAHNVRSCTRCVREGRDGIVSDSSLDSCTRCGARLKGNRAAQKHGLRSRPELHPDTARALVETVDTILEDHGYSLNAEAQKAEDRIAAYVFRSQATDYARLELLIDSGFTRWAARGGNAKDAAALARLIGIKAGLGRDIGVERSETGVQAQTVVSFGGRGRAQDVEAAS